MAKRNNASLRLLLIPALPPHSSAVRREGGFTLIELSIVLVIIGLVVGGVLAGKELMHAARIRNQIAQLDYFTAALYTFRNKYGGLPGDLQASKAAQLGLYARSGADGHGDGDGNLESCNCFWAGCNPLGNPIQTIGCESTLFWRDLSDANLTDRAFTQATDALVQLTPSTVEHYLPRSKLHGTSYIHAIFINSHVGATVAFVISGIQSSDVNGRFALTAPGLSAVEAYAIDSKMDDGIPRRGRMQSVHPATGVGTVSGRAGQAFGNCLGHNMADFMKNEYLLSGGGENTLSCQTDFVFQ